MEAAIRTNYNAHLDAKKRLTLRGASHEYYNVKEYDNGFILLEPRELGSCRNIRKYPKNDG